MASGSSSSSATSEATTALNEYRIFGFSRFIAFILIGTGQHLDGHCSTSDAARKTEDTEPCKRSQAPAASRGWGLASKPQLPSSPRDSPNGRSACFPTFPAVRQEKARNIFRWSDDSSSYLVY